MNGVNLLTLDQRLILSKIGSLSDSLMQDVNRCLKAALELP